MDEKTIYWLMFGAIGMGFAAYGFFLKHRMEKEERKEERKNKHRRARLASRKRVAPHAAS